MNRLKSKVLSLILAICMIFTMLPVTTFAEGETFTDTAGHWAESSIEKWVAYDVLKGSDGAFHPNDPITRAELAAVLVRVIGYTETASTGFTDVPSGAWYYGDVSKLNAAGIMNGDGAGTMRPTASITREEAAVMIARAFDVDENSGNEAPFPDAADISGWASFLVDGMKAAGYISGDRLGRFNPKANITRAEVVTILDNMIEVYLSGGGERDCELIGEISGNVLVNTADTHVKNLYTSGNLYLTEGIGNGDMTLENVTVTGRLFIRGGGSNSIHLVGGSYDAVYVDSGTNPHLDLSDDTVINRINLNSSASVTHDGVTVSYNAATDTVTFGGTIDKVALNADGTATVTIDGIVYDVIPPEGTVSKFELGKDAVVKEMIINAPADINGEGKIEKMDVHTDGVIIDKSVDVKPENIKVDKDIDITIGDKDYTGEGATLPKETPAPSGGGGGGGSGGGGNPSTPSYVVTWSADGGTPAPTQTSVTSGGSITAPAAMTKPGYSFGGWYSEAALTNPVTFPVTNVTAAASFYAKWTLVQSTLGATASGSIAEVGAATNIAFTVTGLHPTDILSTTAGANSVLVAASSADISKITVGTVSISGNVVTVPVTGGAAGGPINLTLNLTPYDGNKYITGTMMQSYTQPVTVVTAGTPYIEAISLSPSGPLTQTYGDQPFTVTVSGGTLHNPATQGDAPIFTVTSGDTAVATVSTTLRTFTVTMLKAGAADITVTASYTGAADVTATLSLTVDKANPTIEGTPDAITDATPDQTFTSLNGVTVKDVDGGTLPGAWSGTAQSTPGTQDIAFTFTPTDTDNYNTATTTVSVTVPKPVTVTAGTHTTTELFFTFDNGGIPGGVTVNITYNTNQHGTLTRVSDTAWKLTGLTANTPYTINAITAQGYTITGSAVIGQALTTAAAAAEPDGSVVNPFPVATAADLAKVGSGNDGWTLDKYYKLTANVEVTSWTPIGETSVSGGSPFTGSFDGNGHTVTFNNVTITDTLYCGLFGYIIGGSVCDLTVAGKITATNTESVTLGGVAGTITGDGATVERCAVTAALNATSSGAEAVVGGVTGANLGTVKNCYTTGSISATAATSISIGGIAGLNNGTTENCYATGIIEPNTASEINMGGIVGKGGDVKNCVALNASMSASGYTTLNDGRISGGGGITYANNYAVVMAGFNDGTLNDKDGASIINTEENADWWSNSASGIWKDVWGTIDSAPWQWDSANKKPVLYWQRP